MHSKDKGTLGECAFMKEMALKEIPVFKEIGDNSKTDLIILVDYNPLKVQAKAYSVDKTGAVVVYKKKSGPNYRFTYKNKHIDFFSVYVIEEDFVFYVPFKMFGKQKQLNFRINPAKKDKRIRYAEDFKDFKKIIKDNFRFNNWKKNAW